MAENKTKPTDASVDDYIASRANAQQHADCRELMALFKSVTRAIDKAPAIDTWRCGGGGFGELSSDPDPTPGRADHVRAQRIDEDSRLL